MLQVMNSIVKPSCYAEDLQLSKKFLPYFQFHLKEHFHPSCIEFILKHASCFNGHVTGRNPTPCQKTSLSSVNVDDLIRLEVSELYGNLNLRGHPSGRSGQLNTSEFDQVAVYSHVQRGEKYTDILYILLYNWNGPAGLPGVEYTGSNRIGAFEHDFDLEYIRVRVLNEDGIWKLQKVYFSAHDNCGDSCLPAQLHRHVSSFKVFVSVNSHACYPREQTWIRAAGLANDYTNSKGICWHPFNNIQMIYAPS